MDVCQRLLVEIKCCQAYLYVPEPEPSVLCLLLPLGRLTVSQKEVTCMSQCGELGLNTPLSMEGALPTPARVSVTRPDPRARVPVTHTPIQNSEHRSEMRSWAEGEDGSSCVRWAVGVGGRGSVWASGSNPRLNWPGAALFPGTVQ